MKIFNLPDLGEGLPDAEIREWYVKPGESVTLDQPIASMETAKALVDVPAPFDGTIEKLFGEPGDTVDTGEPLIGFTGEASTQEATPEVNATVAAAPNTTTVKATPQVKMLAKKLGVDLDTITPTGPNNLITKDDVEAAAGNTGEPLPAVRRAMALAMRKSHQAVVPVTLMDDADINAWVGKDNITIRLIRAVQAACAEEPMLNCHFDGEQLTVKKFTEVNLGLAVDTSHGLYVPVLRDLAKQSDQDLRVSINSFKEKAQSKSISADDQKDATIILSNFGSLAGRYATPIVTPPMTAIIGIGRSYDAIVPTEAGPATHKMIPISLTCDHRAVTGGEMTRFLRKMIEELSK